MLFNSNLFNGIKVLTNACLVAVITDCVDKDDSNVVKQTFKKRVHVFQTYHNVFQKRVAVCINIKIYSYIKVFFWN